MYITELEGSEEHDQLVGHTQSIVVLNLWAPWCQCSVKQVPILKKVAMFIHDVREHHFHFASVNVDRYPEIAAVHGVRVVPTTLILHKGRTVEELTGLHYGQQLVETVLKVPHG